MTRARLIYSAIFIAIILLLVYIDVRIGEETAWNRPGVVLFASAVGVGLLVANEVLHFHRGLESRIKPWAVYAGTLFTIVVAYSPVFIDTGDPLTCPTGRLGWLAWGFVGAVGIAFVSQMVGYRPGVPVIDDVARTILIIAYAGLLISFWGPIRDTGNNLWGMVALLSLFVTVKMSDAAAWLFGKLWGRRKLAPALSPGKTVEGFFGGLLGGVLGAAIVFYAVAPMMTGEATAASPGLIVAFAIAVTLAGVLGDLTESLLKRDAGVKNSSSWLPGLGGIADLVDSLVTAGPVVLAFWMTGWMGPAGTG